MIKFIPYFLLYCLSTLAHSGTDGMWPSYLSVISNYESHIQVSELDIQKHIQSSNKTLSKAVTSKLAKEILDASSCFQIDSLYLTGLIKKESTFKLKAKSNTGAAGLTQMTGPGIQELKDQLGFRGNDYARKKNISYFTSTAKKCLGDEWTSFNSTFKLKSNSKVKAQLMANSKYSIYAGSILLKVYLSNVQDNCPTCTISQLYSKALEQYNGDTNKAQYALKIQTYVDDWNDSI